MTSLSSPSSSKLLTVLRSYESSLKLLKVLSSYKSSLKLLKGLSSHESSSKLLTHSDRPSPAASKAIPCKATAHRKVALKLLTVLNLDRPSPAASRAIPCKATAMSRRACGPRRGLYVASEPTDIMVTHRRDHSNSSPSACRSTDLSPSFFCSLVSLFIDVTITS